MNVLKHIAMALLCMSPCGMCVAQKMQLNLKEKDSYTLRVLTEQKTMFDGMGGKNKTEHEEHDVALALDVKSIHGQKVNLIGRYSKIEYTKHKRSQSGADSLVVNGSEKKNNYYSILLSNLTDKPFSIPLDKKGKCGSLLGGLDTLDNHLFDNTHIKVSDMSKMMSRHRMKNTYGERTVRSLIEGYTAVLPDSVVNVGGKWRVKHGFMAMVQGLIDVEYTLEEETAAAYVITGKAKIGDTDKPYVYSYNSVSVNLYETKGTVDTRVEVDKQTGMVKAGRVNVNLKGVAHFLDLNGKENNNMAMPLSVELKQKLQ